MTLNPAVALSLFPEGSKEAFHTYFHPGNTFYFYSPMSFNFLAERAVTVLYFVFGGGGAQYLSVKLFCQRLYLLLGALSLELGTRRNYPFSGPWLRPYIIRLGLHCTDTGIETTNNIHIKHDS